MARMVPFPALPTRSAAERRLYEGFLKQLDDAYVVYHSVDWLLVGDEGAPREGEADFVITHPQHGLLVLEVKGGRIDYDPATRRWSTTGRRGTDVLDKDPFAQASEACRSLVEILEAMPGWRSWRPSFGYGVAFPDGRYDRAAHPGAPPEVVIDRRHLEDLAVRIRRIMEVHRRPGRTFGARGMEAVERALGFRVEVRTPLGVLFDEEDKKIVQLTDEQAWVRGWITKRRRAAVVGPAGSGKTLLAVEIARRMAGGGNPTLLTCFNRRIAADLAARTTAVPHLHVAHFHALAHELAQEAGLPLPAEEEAGPGSAYFEEHLPELLMEAAERLGPRFDVMVVDEAQDFRPHWWPSLLSLHTDPDEGRLYVFADDGQNLYGGEIPDVVPEDERFTLPHNLRNTREIGDFVSVFYRGGEPPVTRGPTGRPVEILGYSDDEALARLLATVLRNLIDEEGLRPEDVAVLTPSGLTKSRLRSHGAVDGFVLAEEPAGGEILATSVHAFKGMERPVVVLAELGDKHLEDLEQYLYVGASRARNHLLVLATEPVAEQLRERTALTPG